MLAERGLAVKLQIAVDLEKVEMAAHLNRTAARVMHNNLHRAAGGVVGTEASGQDCRHE